MKQHNETTGLPPGYRVLNDGPGREVLLDERCDDPAQVFATYEAAAKQAWLEWRYIYKPEASSP